MKKQKETSKVEFSIDACGNPTTPTWIVSTIVSGYKQNTIKFLDYGFCNCQSVIIYNAAAFVEMGSVAAKQMLTLLHKTGVLQRYQLVMDLNDWNVSPIKKVFKIVTRKVVVKSYTSSNSSKMAMVILHLNLSKLAKLRKRKPYKDLEWKESTAHYVSKQTAVSNVKD